MPKFTFICEDDPMPFSESVVTKRTVEFDAVQINDVVSEFELFLRGAGFNPQGVLDFVDETYYYGEPAGPEWNDDGINISVPDSVCHSEHYFDTERNK
jgi:hypothetical protein